MTIAYDDFRRVEIHVGRVQRAEPFPEARQPALKLWIDFGEEIGVRKTMHGPERESSAIHDAGVIQLVREEMIIASDQRGDHTEVRLITGAEDQRRRLPRFACSNTIVSSTARAALRA